jgi:BCD family chlorophyll transporter-like MFS transporter
MGLDSAAHSGLALGAWGAVQATGAGIAIGLAGIIRDVVTGMALHGRLGAALVSHATGYGAVYYIEIILLFASLIAIGPLARHGRDERLASADNFDLAQFPT